MRAWFNGRTGASQALDEGSIPFARLFFVLILLVPATAQAVAVSSAAARKPATLESLLKQGHALYARGDYQKAVASYEAAVKVSSTSPQPWLNGGAVYDEAGEPKKAAQWYARAAALDFRDDEALGAQAWAQLRAHDFAEAAANFRRVLQKNPDHPWAKLGLAQAELASSQPKAAVTLLTRSPASGPAGNLAALALGGAYETLKDNANAASAYRHAIGLDSAFIEARQALGRLLLREKKFEDAYRQLSRALASDPHNPEMTALLAKVEPLLGAGKGKAEPVRSPLGKVAVSPVFPKDVPALRIGVATTPLGRPRARQAVAFSATTDFALKDPKSGKVFAEGRADEFWVVRLKRVKKKGLLLEISDPSGKVFQTRQQPFLVAADDREQGLVALSLGGEPVAAASGADRVLRGEVEFSAFKRTLRVVNRIDLENYTHGVVSAEMPVRSPLEALKAQAVVARTHAIYIQKVTRRHRRDGYDLCDEQHCQVYAGARAESERSRSVVEATRGIIVTYKDRPAHVIYSSNCGGHTQDGKGITGWGDVPYWLGVPDSPDALPAPDSPWGLRQWLGSVPAAFCKPSSFAHPAHFRWARRISWAELSRRLDRRYRTGRLQRLRVLRRAASGNVNALLLEGSRRKVKVDSELALRGLPGLGSLRSTLFVFTPEFGADGKPAAMVFRGGGWGHGVGMCQSGAMGRAESGQNFPQIILSYYPGTALGRAAYAPEEAY